MAQCSSEIANTAGLEDAKEVLYDECETIWNQLKECQNKTMHLKPETLLKSDAKLSLLMLEMKALTADQWKWKARNPEIISGNPYVLLQLGKEELQKVKTDLEMVLSTVRSKNKQLDQDLEREQQWYEEQKQLLGALAKTEGETKTQDEQLSTESLREKEFGELKNKFLKLKTYKEELLSAFGEFLDEHYFPPETSENTKKRNSSAEPAVELTALAEILELLINNLLTKPHDPYVPISESFWPPYIELLLRYGIALRHPEDPNRMRLEAFHK